MVTVLTYLLDKISGFRPRFRFYICVAMDILHVFVVVRVVVNKLHKVRAALCRYTKCFLYQ